MEGEKETTFYSDERGVHITNARAIVGATTYSMANITSVSMAVKPADRIAGIVLIIVGFIILAIFAGMVIPGV